MWSMVVIVQLVRLVSRDNTMLHASELGINTDPVLTALTEGGFLCVSTSVPVFLVFCVFHVIKFLSASAHLFLSLSPV